MAGFVCDGLSDLLDDFAALAELPDSVGESMLHAEADVLIPAQKETAKAMLAGPYSKGITLYGLAKSGVKLTSTGKVLHITFKGSVQDDHHKKPTRIGDIAFVNEFGKKGQPARPFIRTANEQKADEAVSAAAAVYDEYLKTKGL